MYRGQFSRRILTHPLVGVVSVAISIPLLGWTGLSRPDPVKRHSKQVPTWTGITPSVVQVVAGYSSIGQHRMKHSVAMLLSYIASATRNRS